MNTAIQKRKDGYNLCFDEATSLRMAGVRRAHTGPELVVRHILHALGHRFRVGNRDLPGSPDIANRRRKWVVFVHGCFWHRHGCKATTTPTRNRPFWEAKFERNVARDQERVASLDDLGFEVVVVWECETKRDLTALQQRLKATLPKLS